MLSRIKVESDLFEIFSFESYHKDISFFKQSSSLFVILLKAVKMINSLKLSALETSYLSKGFNEHPKSQPASPRKYHLKKTISVMSNRHPPANIWKESSMSLV